MSNVTRDLRGYEIIQQVIYKSGCFTKRMIWVKGWHKELNAKFQFIKLIYGYTGKETQITLYEVTPSCMLEVIEPSRIHI